MSRPRFEFALEHIRPSEWELLEQLASTFLTSEFSSLRTIAWPSGDGGRDGQLFSPTDEPGVMIQYSVTKDPAAKIRNTAETISTNFPTVSLLIYATSQAMDPGLVDSLKKELRTQYRLALDVRDRRWFLDRQHGSPANEFAAEELAKRIVDPYLASKSVYENKGQALSQYESQVAFVHLTLQRRDDDNGKGLTKTCFEALVHAVLRDTHSESRLARSEIHRRVISITQGHESAKVVRLVDAALKRLTKKQVRHWTKEDEFCLTHDERTAVNNRLAEYEVANTTFEREIEDAIDASARAQGWRKVDDRSALVTRVRRLLERLLLKRGEAFAGTAIRSAPIEITEDEAATLIADDFTHFPATGKYKARIVAVTKSALSRLLEAPSSEAVAFLRGMSDAYTLMAFLRQTPDVQSVVIKMFSHGEIWLDTNVLLPLLAESLCSDDSRQYSHLLRAARDAGVALRCTEGVLEEVERHINRARVCATNATEWRGPIPFLYSAFVWSAKPGGFASFAEQFIGASRPLDDLAAYLNEEHGILRGSMEDEVLRVDPELRRVAEAYWRDVHEGRRGTHGELDPMTMNRLISHDVENCLGVIHRRGSESASIFGFKTWWLSLDAAAFRALRVISHEVGAKVPIPGAALSPDFLATYLALGPARRLLTRNAATTLPIILDMTAARSVPRELVSAAAAVRDTLASLPERVRSRRIRDALDAARRKEGPLALRGTGGAERRIEAVLAGRDLPDDDAILDD